MAKRFTEAKATPVLEISTTLQMVKVNFTVGKIFLFNLVPVRSSN